MNPQFIESWTNHVGTFVRNPATGAHHGPFESREEGVEALCEIVRVALTQGMEARG